MSACPAGPLTGHILTVLTPTNFVQSSRQNLQSKMIVFDRFSGKLLKFVSHQVSNFKAENAPSSIAVLALPQNPLGSVPPDRLAGFKGSISKGTEGTGVKGWEE